MTTTDELPPTSAAGQAGNPDVGLRAIVVVLGVAATALRSWVAFTGWFSVDDYAFYTSAFDSSLSAWDYAMTPYNGHLMPGAMAWVWATMHADPLGFSLVMVTCMVLQLAVNLAMLWLLSSLFGWRPAILPIWAFFIFSPLSLPAGVWWAAALNQLPMQLFMLLALVAFVSHARSGSHASLLGVVASLLGGLAFSEKTILVIPLIGALAWLFVVGGPLRSGLPRAVRRFRGLWIAVGGVGAAYTWLYLAYVPSPVRGTGTMAEGLEVLTTALRRAVLPALIGGPWRWAPWGYVDAIADPPVVGQVVALLALLVVVRAAVTRSAGRRAVALAGAAVAVDGVLIWTTRVQLVGVEGVAAEYRYFTELAVVVSLAFGLAFLPLDGRLAPQRPRTPRGRWLDAFVPIGQRETVAAGVVTAFVFSAGVSTATFQDRWSGNPGREFFANAVTSLTDTSDDVVLYDGPVPDRVVWGQLYPANLPSRLFEPVDPGFVPFAPGSVATDLYEFGPDGTIGRSVVSGPTAVIDGGYGCNPVKGWTSVALTAPLFEWSWTARVEYKAERAGTVLVRTDHGIRALDADPGTNVRFVALDGAFDRLEMFAAPSQQVCLLGAVVGLPQPLDW